MSRVAKSKQIKLLVEIVMVVIGFFVLVAIVNIFNLL
ncbi:MAG: hypothetical protein ACI93V_001065 [Alteromonadaceae bacterium]|jgi:hypothetical protein